MVKSQIQWSLFVFAAVMVTAFHSFAVTIEPSVPADVSTQLQQDLVFIDSLQGSNTSPLHQEIYGAMQGASYKAWFDGRIRSIGLNACGGGNAVACVIPWLGSDKMWITQNYIKFSHPAIARLMVVYHEARHSEVEHGNWAHATCPTPFLDVDGKEIKSIWTGATLAGEDGCDETPMGSYGSSAIMLKNLSKYCSSCNEKVKMDAGIYADDQFKRIIDAGAKDQMRRDIFN